MSINDYEVPVASWDMDSNEDPILLCHKEKYPHACSLLRMQNSETPVLKLDTSGNIELGPSEVSISYDEALKIGDAMTVRQSSVDFHVPLNMSSESVFVLNDKFRLKDDMLGIGMSSDPTSTLCVKGDTVTNGNTYINGAVSLFRDTSISHTSYDLTELDPGSGSDTLLYVKGGDIKTDCNVMTEGYVSAPQYRGTDYFVNTLGNKSNIGTDRAYSLLRSVKAYQDPDFSLSSYDTPYIGFDVEEIAQEVPEMVRNDQKQVSLTAMVGLLVNVVSDLADRMNKIEAESKT